MEEKNVAKKKGIFKYFIKMLVLFVLVSLLTQIVPYFMNTYINNVLAFGKYSEQFVFEILAFVVIVAIVLKKSGNYYVFKEKKEEPLGKSLLRAWPMFFVAFPAFLLALYEIIFIEKRVDVYNLISCFLLCISVGLFEEFLCRGWLQNEFIERYGDTHKNVILSIVLSSLVFGLMHLSNVWAGQTLFETIMQVIQATSLGMILGSIYYRTKNIWSVVIIHAIYDFFLFIEKVNYIKDCTTNYYPPIIQILSIASTILIVVVNVVYSMKLLQKSKVEKLINSENDNVVEKTNNKKYNIIVIILLIMIYGLTISQLFIPEDTMKGAETCYEYPISEIKNYETHQVIRDAYEIENDNLNLKIFLDTGSLVFEADGKQNKLGNMNVVDAVVFDNYGDYEIMYVAVEENDYVIYHSTYLKDGVEYDWKSLEKSFKKYVVPNVNIIGYINIEDELTKYPYFIDNVYNYYYIKDNIVYRIG